MNNQEQILIQYIKTINNIDDFLEYRYKNLTTEQLRDKIISYIDTMTTNLKGIHNDNTNI